MWRWSISHLSAVPEWASVSCAIDRTARRPIMAQPDLPLFTASTFGPKVLSGWKDIASYLGRGVRTVQRYERELRLPVRRPAGKARGLVIALSHDLDAWVSQSPTKPLAVERSNSRHTSDVRSGVSTMRSLCAEARKLQSAIRAQHTTLATAILQITQALVGPNSSNVERFRTTATDQKQRATEMIEVARTMSERAIEMRNPPRGRFIVSC